MVHIAEEYLYAAETMAARILRFKIQPDGTLTGRQVFGPDGLGIGASVDGFALDSEGNGGTLTPPDMFACMGATLQFPTSVAFGGPDLKTVYLGSLAMPRLVSFRSPVAGAALPHWKP